MKKTLAIMLILMFSMMAVGCGDPRTINDVTYDTYGIATAHSKKKDGIEYRCIVGNIVWSVLLCETIIAPIYFIGFSLFEPVGVLDANKPKGAL